MSCVSTGRNGASAARGLLLGLCFASQAWASPCVAQTCYIQPLPWVTDWYGSTEGRSRPHRATDYDGPGGGADIPAVADGQVTHIEQLDDTEASECLGNFVEIRHPDGMFSTYCHLNALYVGLGQWVSRGQAIGQMGDSGWCVDGAHLHLVLATRTGRYWGGAWDDGTVDPHAYINDHLVCRPDRDGDGSYEGDDCDDADPNRRPGRAEACDSIDNDCDGVVDEALSRTCGTDVGECRTGVSNCAAGVWGACVGEIPPNDEACDTLDNDCDDVADDDRVCEHDDAALAASLFGRAASDVDGDGRADACMRTPVGFECLVSGASGFDRTLRGPDMADEDGWDQRATYTSVRMGDVDGDGADDLCARSGDRIVCYRATGDGFAESLVTMPLGEPSPLARSAELWMADVDGDARGDLCVRGANGLRCQPSGGGALLVLRALSDDAGWGDVGRHGSIRFGDVSGDGRDDVCARDEDGLVCWLVGEAGFDRTIVGPRWSDASGWSEPRFASTFRLADVDCDGLADACARSPDGFSCWLADGRGFGAVHRGPRMDGADGWDERAAYSTIRMGDVDGDGASDVCARNGDGVRCWLWTGESFGRQIIGPALTDAEGWNDAARYTTLRLEDVDGDARADVCARGVDGVRCWISAGTSFSRLWRSPVWDDAMGLADPAYASSLTIAGGVAPAEATSASCACRAQPGRATGGWWVTLALVVAVVLRRKRRGVARVA